MTLDILVTNGTQIKVSVGKLMTSEPFNHLNFFFFFFSIFFVTAPAGGLCEVTLERSLSWKNQHRALDYDAVLEMLGLTHSNPNQVSLVAKFDLIMIFVTKVTVKIYVKCLSESSVLKVKMIMHFYYS